MIDDFGPYMTTEQVELFRGYLVTVDDANSESIALQADLIAAGAMTPDDATRARRREPTERCVARHQHRHDRSDRSDGEQHRNVRGGGGAALLQPVPWFFLFLV